MLFKRLMMLLVVPMVLSGCDSSVQSSRLTKDFNDNYQKLLSEYNVTEFQLGIKLQKDSTTRYNALVGQGLFDELYVFDEAYSDGGFGFERQHFYVDGDEIFFAEMSDIDFTYDETTKSWEISVPEEIINKYEYSEIKQTVFNAMTTLWMNLEQRRKNATSWDIPPEK